ncbi:MAG TPA: choice-of-anchor J domain-containing protein [Bacteroidia bacterium]|nr:choice-of-anchor J domain-containing protein [Bacteroidia bacterium]
MKKIYLTIIVGNLLLTSSLSAQTFPQTFDSLALLLNTGWSQVNLSNPLGSDMWHQGDPGSIGIPAHTGATATSFVQSSFQATDSAGSGTISDWIMSPVVTLNNGDSIAFWVISYNSATYPDNIECWISPNGGMNPGTDEFSTGDYSILVYAVNPNLDMTSFPSVAVNGDTWTRFAGVVSGLSGATSCSVAFRYFVTDGGGTGANSSTVGLDDVQIVSSAIGISKNILGGVSMFPNPTNELVHIYLGENRNQQHAVNVTNSLGQIVYTEYFSGQTIVGLGDFTAGVYSVEVRNMSSGEVIRQLIVKQ